MQHLGRRLSITDTGSLVTKVKPYYGKRSDKIDPSWIGDVFRFHGFDDRGNYCLELLDETLTVCQTEKIRLEKRMQNGWIDFESVRESSEKISQCVERVCAILSEYKHTKILAARIPSAFLAASCDWRTSNYDFDDDDVRVTDLTAERETAKKKLHAQLRKERLAKKGIRQQKDY